MLTLVHQFVHCNVQVQLYEGLEPRLVGAEKTLIFLRQVVLNGQDPHGWLRSGSVEEWTRQVKANIEQQMDQQQAAS